MIIFAGLPAIMQFSSLNFLLTIEPAPTIQFDGICAPFRIIALVPTHTWFPIVISSGSFINLFELISYILCPSDGLIKIP